jgi:hypothetical protein
MDKLVYTKVVQFYCHEFVHSSILCFSLSGLIKCYCVQNLLIMCRQISFAFCSHMVLIPHLYQE